MRGILPLPANYAGWVAWATQLIRVMNEELGERQTVLTVTLRPNETTTTITNAAISGNSVALLAPTTASAAASAVHQAATRGSITLTHTSDAAADRTFRVVLA